MITYLINLMCFPFLEYKCFIIINIIITSWVFKGNMAKFNSKYTWHVFFKYLKQLQG
jgi:hypothetical protein